MSTLTNVLRRLHSDEEGMETMQVVIIFGVAALILALLYALRTKIFEWVDEALKNFGIKSGK